MGLVRNVETNSLPHPADTSENTFKFRISENTDRSFTMGVYENFFFFSFFSIYKSLQKKVIIVQSVRL